MELSALSPSYNALTRGICSALPGVLQAILSYEGTAFRGWSKQPDQEGANGQRTVEGVLSEALQPLVRTLTAGEGIVESRGSLPT